jgi:hypothetical protein
MDREPPAGEVFCSEWAIHPAIRDDRGPSFFGGIFLRSRINLQIVMIGAFEIDHQSNTPLFGY